LIDGEVVSNTPNNEENIEYRDYLEGKPIFIIVYLNKKERPRNAPLYQLSINGISFHNLPKIFELGAARQPPPRKPQRRVPKISGGGEGGTRRRTPDL